MRLGWLAFCDMQDAKQDMYGQGELTIQMDDSLKMRIAKVNSHRLFFNANFN